MRTSTFFPLVAVLLTAFVLPPELLAQSTNVRPRNKNQSVKFKSGIFRGSANLIESNSVTASIGGGQSNAVTFGADYAVVGGGFKNVVANDYGTVGGGGGNTASGAVATVGGGEGNQASDVFTTVGGGLSNTANSRSSTVAGGEANTAGSAAATVGGGEANNASGEGSTVAGGWLNTASGSYATVAGGQTNTAGANHATVGGGDTNSATGIAATVAGGSLNEAAGTRSAIGGGYNNTTTGILATIPGGNGNSATNYSFAAGRYAKAEHENSFVWGSQPGIVLTTTTSFADSSFTVRCHGGARFYTAAGTGTGAWLKAGLSSWDVLSDSNAKTKIKSVDARDVLSKVSSLPMTEWEYRSAPHRRFFGPMSQDFHAAFGLGDDTKTINTLDADGVLFLSVKGLVEELKERDNQIEELKAWSKEQGAKSQAEIEELKMKSAQVEELRAKLQALEERLNSLPPAP